MWPITQGRTSAGLPSAIAINPRAVSLSEGIRAALSVAAIVAVSTWLHRPPLMEAALAAWFTCLCDAGGPIRQRVPFLLGFGLAGAAITAGFGLLGTLAPLPVVIVIAAAGVFCTSLLRIYGQAMMQVGNLLSVVLVLALTRDVPDPGRAAQLGLVFLGGSLWATLLTMVIWRVYPYAPALRSVAECWRALSLLVADLHRMLHHPAPGEAEWDRHAREHRHSVRAAIEAARVAVLATVRTRGPVSGRAAQTWMRLEAAEQIFGALIALADMLQTDPDAAERDAADRMLRRLRPLLLTLGEAMVTEPADRSARLERAAASIADTAAALPGTKLHRIAGRIAERLRIAITLANPKTLAPVPEGPVAGGWRTVVLVPLRANLDPGSAALLHALRTAAAALVGLAVTLSWPTSYGYWLTITLVLTMQPYFAVTITRAAERIGGTVLGGALGALVAIACPTPVAMAVALFPLAVLALALRGVNFGLFMTFVTPVIGTAGGTGPARPEPGRCGADANAVHRGGRRSGAAVQRAALARLGAGPPARRTARRDRRAWPFRLHRNRRPAGRGQAGRGAAGPPRRGCRQQQRRSQSATRPAGAGARRYRPVAGGADHRRGAASHGRPGLRPARGGPAAPA